MKARFVYVLCQNSQLLRLFTVFSKNIRCGGDETLKYYFIKDLSLFAKGEGIYKNYIYVNDEWLLDKDHIVSNRLIGYDPYEDDDSPFKIGNTSIMDNIEVISEETFNTMNQIENHK